MNVKRCVFLTMDNTDGWSIDADLGIAPLAGLGWSVDTLAWRRKDVDWNDWDAVYIGTPWDYPDDAAHFMAVLETIDRSAAVLVNPLALVRWSLAKTYLRDLQERGAAIVPSLWYEALDATLLDGLFDACASERIIIKPVVSTNATDTFLLNRALDRTTRQLLARTFAMRPCMVQPFISGIREEGEYSLFYLGGSYSHAIQKTPKAGDFRVQEEHGASIVSVDAELALVQTADRLLATVDPSPVYARCDFVRGEDGRFLLMELEVIEPSLYLRMDTAAPMRFARAFDRYVHQQTGG
jgi:hypothetical protein